MCWAAATRSDAQVRPLTTCCREQAGGIAPSVIQGGMTNKLVQEFLFLRAQASEPLGQFLDLIT